MILQNISRFFLRLSGDKSLNSLEKLCLDAWRDTMDEKDKRILDEQLGQLAYIQRQAAGAKVCFYYDEEHIHLFLNELPDFNVATIVLGSTAAPSDRMKVKIFTHRGRFFSIEFPKRPDRYMKLHGMTADSLKVDAVIIHPAENS